LHHLEKRTGPVQTSRERKVSRKAQCLFTLGSDQRVPQLSFSQGVVKCGWVDDYRTAVSVHPVNLELSLAT